MPYHAVETFFLFPLYFLPMNMHIRLFMDMPSSFHHPRHTRTPVTPPGRARVLYVDDEPINLHFFAQIFQDEFDVLTADGGEEALRLFKRTKDIACIVTDQRMPGMNGVELLVRVRRISPHTIRIILSAWSDSETLMQAVNEGSVSRYLLKPWDENELRIACRRAAEEFHLRREREQLIRDLEKKESLLTRQAAELDEANQTLRAMVQHSETACEEIRQEILARIGQKVLPLLGQCLKETPAGRQHAMLACMDHELRKLTAPFLHQDLHAEGLSPAERRIAALVHNGFNIKEISVLLGLSPRTVENHFHRIRTKLGGKGKPVKLLSLLVDGGPE